jgi:hypothetical protein
MAVPQQALDTMRGATPRHIPNTPSSANSAPATARQLGATPPADTSASCVRVCGVGRVTWGGGGRKTHGSVH